MSVFTLADWQNLNAALTSRRENRASEYKRYRELARKRNLQPGTFREYCEAMDEYEREWEVASYEYDNTGRT